MSLFRKEALEHRSRALFGEVVLRNSVASWIITVLLILVMVIFVIGLFFVTVETDGGPVRLLDWILSSGADASGAK
ncbi:hypothetical protein N9W89_11470 [Hellea sp.]|nr:hypothetical protein [Hellea sp.]